MESYLECLINNGEYRSLELYRNDFDRIRNSEEWIKKTDGFLMEIYYDSRDKRLSELGYVLQVNVTESHDAILSLKNIDDVVGRQYVSQYENRKNISECLSDEMKEKLQLLNGKNPLELICIGASSARYKIAEYMEGWIVLAEEIVYGRHQYSLAFIRNNDSDNKWGLDNYLSDRESVCKSRKNRSML